MKRKRKSERTPRQPVAPPAPPLPPEHFTPEIETANRWQDHRRELHRELDAARAAMERVRVVAERYAKELDAIDPRLTDDPAERHRRLLEAGIRISLGELTGATVGDNAGDFGLVQRLIAGDLATAAGVVADHAVERDFLSRLVKTADEVVVHRAYATMRIPVGDLDGAGGLDDGWRALSHLTTKTPEVSEKTRNIATMKRKDVAAALGLEENTLAQRRKRK